MIARFTRISLCALITAMMCCTTLFSTSCSKEQDSPDVSLTGIFMYDSWEISIDNNSGTGIFTKAAGVTHKIGDNFLKVTNRTGFNSWKGIVYDKDLLIQEEGTIVLENDFLTIKPINNPEYKLYRLILNGGGGSSGGGSGSGSNGSGCASVQCSGTTQAGKRCARMTTNCNGRCYQH